MDRRTPGNTPKRIVVLIQGNKTTDFYFPTLTAWGADILETGVLVEQAPNHDPLHDRNAWVYDSSTSTPPDVRRLTHPLPSSRIVPRASTIPNPDDPEKHNAY